MLNLPPMPGVFPDCPAPVVRNSGIAEGAQIMSHNLEEIEANGHGFVPKWSVAGVRPPSGMTAV